MGIRGLSSYVVQRSETFSKKIELHDTKIIVDGTCIACQLYHDNQFNYCFGGDYLEYANCVSDFFDELLKCNITPIIIFDGGLEDKKLNTVLTRSKERVSLIYSSTAANDEQLIPSFTKDVFRFIVQEKNITIVQSLFEADDHVASVARLLKCPVLSNDSDFFVFDVKYVPFSSLEKGIFKSTNGQGFFKNCRLYTNDNFIANFPGMHKESLPLAAALLGNDYIHSYTFNNFFASISNVGDMEESYNKIHYKIETTLKWLQNYSLDEAVAIVLNQLDLESRGFILETLEMIINGYLVPSSEMLTPLGYTQDEISELTKAISYKHYKFAQREALVLSDEKISSSEINSTSYGTHMIDILSLDNNIKPNIKSQVNKSIPTWFLHEYYAAMFPGYFMDMLHRQLIIGTEHMEDYAYPTSIYVSLRIIRATFKLLSNGTTNSEILEYIARGRETHISKYRLDCNEDSLKHIEFPTLENLMQLSEARRKQIFISTLGVSDKLVMEFPPTWRLYIAVIKYWYVRTDRIFHTAWHLYSLILMIIYHVVRKTIKHGSYFEKSAAVGSERPAGKNGSVEDALQKVHQSDCIKMEEFFKSYMSKDEKNFNITIVHAFSLLQNNLKYSMNLNALLGYPYPHLNIADFFSGTMIYNFYIDLSKYGNLDKRIREMFAGSPSILQLFFAISNKLLSSTRKTT